jgi:hypothetical protein
MSARTVRLGVPSGVQYHNLRGVGDAGEWSPQEHVRLTCRESCHCLAGLSRNSGSRCREMVRHSRGGSRVFSARL